VGDEVTAMNGEACRQFLAAGHGTQKLYRGRRVMQMNSIFAALDQLHAALKADPVNRIVEIGTAHGGFTCILQDHDISEGAELHTFDNGARGPCEPVTGVVMYVGSCFDEEWQRLIETLCSAPGRVLLFCDGGDKEREVNTFCKALKPGDVILCHDYLKFPEVMVHDNSLFEPKQWRGCESQYSHVKDELERHGFSPFCETEMQAAFWGCFKRG
jgi:cephalosporin hydroxylase